MKRLISKILVLVMVVCTALNINVQSRAAEVTEETSRAIYVVFDNSGSMYGPGNKAWSQAIYAMEVFAAMMNYDNGDVMKIFPMHNVTTGGTDTTASIDVRSIADIEKIHNMYTPDPQGTPYTQVNTAAAGLGKLLDGGGADEGWLVILTDGIFDSDIPENGMENDLKNKAGSRENMYIQYLAVGSNIEKDSIPETDESIGLYGQLAEESAQVTNELAVISNRIFERNEYTGFGENKELSFDIPISRLIVFAQGEKVSVNSLKNEEGGEVNMESNYEVSCSSTDGSGLTSFVTQKPVRDTSLKGQVAVFADTSAITEGDYTLDVSGADSVQIYYEPDVKFGIGLYRGDDQVDTETIEGGTYDVRVGFINRLTGEFIENTSLLGEPEYKLTVNGEEYGLGGSTGAYQSVEIQVDGDLLELSAEVNYLNNYRDHMELSFKVCTLEMQIDAQTSVGLKEIGNGAGSMTVSATRNGAPLTEEQWKNAVVEVMSRDSEGEDFAVEWDVQPGSTVSTWVITPKYKDGDMFSTGTGPADITVSVSAEIDGDPYGISQNTEMEIKDDRSVFDYLQKYWKQVSISLLLIVLIVGYLPGVKKRFPRKMHRRPTIECSPQRFEFRKKTATGKFEKNRVSIFLPYAAETGRLTFSPFPAKKTARLKAARGKTIEILNTADYRGKREITFNGSPIEESQKGNYRITESTAISVLTPEYKYTCVPNIHKA